MADPRHRHLPGSEFGKDRLAMLSRAAGEQGFPDHLVEKRARVEVFGRSQILE